MGKLYIFCALMATLSLSGCFSLEHSNIKATGEEHVVAINYGWKLFNCVPLCCGNASDSKGSKVVFFRDDVTMEKVQARFIDYVNSRHKEIVDINYYDNSRIVMTIPVLDIPVPYLLCYDEIQISGVLK